MPNYSRLRYREIYPGIDLEYYSQGDLLKYDFIVHPGADPAQIAMHWEGVEHISVDNSGNLLLETAIGSVRERAPHVYQIVNGAQREREGGFVVEPDGTVRFQIAQFDRSWPLVIDPTLEYSTYLGGDNAEWGHTITTDTLGNAYVTGLSNSSNFPTANPFQPALAGYQDGTVIKLDASGSSLIYSTYIGGSGGDQGYGIVVDDFGRIYVTGFTTSYDFPTRNPLQPGKGLSRDAYILELDSDGSLLYSTYLGGNDQEIGLAIATDSIGNIYVTGYTYSADFPTANPLQVAYGGNRDAFVTKLAPSGSALIYSTYLGGSGIDRGYALVVDASGNAYVTGNTGSPDFPTANPLQPTFAGGYHDAFITKVNPIGSGLVFSTYLGGSDLDYGLGIAIDNSGNIYVTGSTHSSDFPTANPLQPSFAGGYYNNSGPWPDGDAFVTKLNAYGSELIYSTYLGGSRNDGGAAIALDPCSNVYITGYTESEDFPIVNPLQATHAGNGDVFITRLNAEGSALEYSTFWGGSGIDYGIGIAVDRFGSAYVTGSTDSLDFPTLYPVQDVYAGNCSHPTCIGWGDAFILKIAHSIFDLGDVNDDGKINTIDARMAQQHADGVVTLTGNQFLAADVDQDGDVDSADATAIAKKGIGLPTGIPGFAMGSNSVHLGQTPGSAPSWLLLAFTVPALLLVRRSRMIAMLLLALGLIGTLSGCVEFAGLPPPGGPAIFLTSTSMPNGATRTINMVVQQITASGGVVSIQGRITFPAGVAIQSVTGLNGFVVKAICGTVGDPCASPNELRFSLVKPSVGGIMNGPVARLAVSAPGAHGTVHTLSWAGNAQAPIVVGGDTNVEITGYSTGNGQVKIR